jgi:hypothetical protein
MIRLEEEKRIFSKKIFERYFWSLIITKALEAKTHRLNITIICSFSDPVR